MTPPIRRIVRLMLWALVASSAIAVASCGGDGANGPLRASQPFFVRVVSGNGQSAPAGSQLADPLVVHVEDSVGVSVPGQPVTFTVTAGGGSVVGVGTSTVSNTHGDASARWTLGTRVGEVQTVEARVLDSDVGQTVVVAIFSATALGQLSHTSVCGDGCVRSGRRDPSSHAEGSASNILPPPPDAGPREGVVQDR